mgnify:CR=1 FL=1
MILTPKSSFYFVRHGETNWNKQHKLMGWKDISLNDKGIEQAQHSAYVLNEIEIGNVFSSSLKRASETASIIGQICELEVTIIDGLKERSFGEYEGKDKDSLNDLCFVSDLNKSSNVESYEAFEMRVKKTINDITSTKFMYPLIVSHGGVFQCLASILAKRKDILCSNGDIFYFSPSIIDKDIWDISLVETKM